jgi:uncharacterized membrane protein HdeD (DUF308 family)
MATDTAPGLFGAGRELLQRQAARWWWVPLVVAAAWFVIAWLVLRADYRSLVAVGVLVGVALLVASINEVAMAAAVGGGWRVLHIALAILFLLGALWGFIRPVNTFFALASVLGLLLFLQGVTYLIRGVALKDATPYWWLDVVSGGLLTLLAIWVSTSDRMYFGTRAALILLWVGFMAIFRGFSDIGLAFTLRRIGRGEAPAETLGYRYEGNVPEQQQREAPARTAQP